jgi:hypothetical protein
LFTYAEKINQNLKIDSSSSQWSGKTPYTKKESDIHSSHSKNKITLQPKLAINAPGDVYEREADAMADKVMRMSIPENVNLKQNEEEEIQRKEGSSNENLSTAPPLVDEIINSSLGKPLDEKTRAFMEPRFGFDFSKVKIYDNDKAAESADAINALAYTWGNNVVFNSGQYNSNSDSGKKLLAHELTHVVQQGAGELQAKGKNNLIQRYFDASGTVGSAIGKSYRISDDLTTAVKVGYPNHDLFAEAGKAAISNILLAGVGSGIALIEESTTFNVSHGSKMKTLKKVVPKNVRNLTSGDSMKISDDCGTSCSVVVGSNRRTALHYDALSKTNAKTMATTPSLMKAEIMKKMLVKWLINPSTSATIKTEIIDTIAKVNAKQLEIDAAKANYAAATTAADKEVKNDIYWAKVDEYGNIMMSFYNKMSESKREEIDKYLEINKFANPGVGQGYTMSTGGTNYPGESTWNFHWGGVVMKSNDQQDTITLENYAVAGDVENDQWDFAMYGTAAKKGQTFHEQHQDTKQHGDRPTTMTIEKK